MKKTILLILCIFALFSCKVVQEYTPKVTGEQAEPFYIQAADNTASVSIRQLKIALIVPSFVYSVDGGKEWRPVNLTTDESSTWQRELKAGEKVYIKAREGEPNATLSGKLLFKSIGECLIGGNIMSLLNSDPDVYGTIQNIPEKAFVGLFTNFEGLKDASKLILPVKTLSANCYSTLFASCPNLEVPPALPATRLDEGCYSEMFLNCKELRSAPALPATSCRTKCYRSMFSGCEKLTNPPSLPATYLAEQCYQYMFKGCKSITDISDFSLPAKTLQDYCYSGMFQDCENLAKVPEGLLTIDKEPENQLMKKYCYSSMFSGCLSLETAPKLMSAKLDEGCYSEMFYNCRKITGFGLPADQLKNFCYSKMFSGCSELKELEVSFSAWKDTATNEWVKDVYSPTEGKEAWFKSPPNLTNITGMNAIPEGWSTTLDAEAQEQMPQVDYEEEMLTEPLYFEAVSAPATIKIVANSAFRDKLNLLPNLSYSIGGSTWKDCVITDLENTTFSQVVGAGQKLYIRAKKDQKVIEGIHFVSDNDVNVGGNIMSLLSETNYNNVTKVNVSSFQNLFKGFEKLVDASELLLPAMELATSCYSGMFQDCKDLVAPPVIFTTNLQPNCYSRMFSGCKALTSAPELNSVILSSYCYSEMFKDCEALETPPVLPAKYIAIGCYSQMFEGCKALTSAPELKANIMLESCYYKMFKGCEGLEEPPVMPAVSDDSNRVVLANLCYSYMFADCYNLKSAPALPEKKLQAGCYAAMFMGCRELKKAPVLPSNELINTCYISMFKDCRKLEEVEVHFLSWNNQATSDWMSGAGVGVLAENTPTFKCYKSYLVPNEADFEYGVDTIPNTWSIADIPR